MFSPWNQHFFGFSLFSLFLLFFCIIFSTKGEVFVLDDGSEVDLDLGNYERFLDIRLNSENNITTGKIFQKVISKERKGEYLGKTVEYVPHITDAIQEWVQQVAGTNIKQNGGDTIDPEVCVIELGGTIGDIESMAFTEAFRQMQYNVEKEDFLTVHVSLILDPKATGEQKTKPTQRSVHDLGAFGLTPDLVSSWKHFLSCSNKKNKKQEVLVYVDSFIFFCFFKSSCVDRKKI